MSGFSPTDLKSELEKWSEVAMKAGKECVPLFFKRDRYDGNPPGADSSDDADEYADAFPADGT